MFGSGFEGKTRPDMYEDMADEESAKHISLMIISKIEDIQRQQSSDVQKSKIISKKMMESNLQLFQTKACYQELLRDLFDKIGSQDIADAYFRQAMERLGYTPSVLFGLLDEYSIDTIINNIREEIPCLQEQPEHLSQAANTELQDQFGCTAQQSAVGEVIETEEKRLDRVYYNVIAIQRILAGKDDEPISAIYLASLIADDPESHVRQHIQKIIQRGDVRDTEYNVISGLLFATLRREVSGKENDIWENGLDGGQS